MWTRPVVKALCGSSFVSRVTIGRLACTRAQSGWPEELDEEADAEDDLPDGGINVDLPKGYTPEEDVDRILSRVKDRKDSVTEAIQTDRRTHLLQLQRMPVNVSLMKQLAKRGLGRKKLRPTTGLSGVAVNVGSFDGRVFPTLEYNLPEIAFIGHSNCGKSTLVNKTAGLIAKAQAVAHVSDRAGWTTRISFYRIGKKPPVLTLVDCPGYGHAAVHTSETRRYSQLTREFLMRREPLCHVCVLVESLRGLTADDQRLLDFVEKLCIPHQVVVTKADQIPVDYLANAIELIRSNLAGRVHASSSIPAISGRTCAGLPDFWDEMRAIAARNSVFVSGVPSFVRRCEPGKPPRRLPNNERNR